MQMPKKYDGCLLANTEGHCRLDKIHPSFQCAACRIYWRVYWTAGEAEVMSEDRKNEPKYVHIIMNRNDDDHQYVVGIFDSEEKAIRYLKAITEIASIQGNRPSYWSDKVRVY